MGFCCPSSWSLHWWGKRKQVFPQALRCYVSRRRESSILKVWLRSSAWDGSRGNHWAGVTEPQGRPLIWPGIFQVPLPIRREHEKKEERGFEKYLGRVIEQRIGFLSCMQMIRIGFLVPSVVLPVYSEENPINYCKPKLWLLLFLLVGRVEYELDYIQVQYLTEHYFQLSAWQLLRFVTGGGCLAPNTGPLNPAPLPPFLSHLILASHHLDIKP